MGVREIVVPTACCFDALGARSPFFLLPVGSLVQAQPWNRACRVHFWRARAIDMCVREVVMPAAYFFDALGARSPFFSIAGWFIGSGTAMEPCLPRTFLARSSDRHVRKGSRHASRVLF